MGASIGTSTSMLPNEWRISCEGARGSRRAVLGQNLRRGGCQHQRALASCMRWLGRPASRRDHGEYAADDLLLWAATLQGHPKRANAAGTLVEIVISARVLAPPNIVRPLASWHRG